MNIIYSHNQSRMSRIGSFLVPTSLEALAYILFAIVLHIILLRGIFAKILIGNEDSIDLARGYISNQGVSAFLNHANQTLGAATIAFFWMIVGAFTYALIWLVEHAAVDIYDDLEDSKAIAPKGYKEKYWETVTSKYMALLASIIGTVGLVSLYIIVLLPLMSRQIAYIVLEPNMPLVYLKAICAVLLTALALYGCVLVFRILRYVVAVVVVRE